MTYVVSDPCIGTTDQSCIEVCPVNCIYTIGEDPDKPDLNPLMVVIDPEECIDCGACEPECPVEAIHLEDNVPGKWEPFIALNAMHNGRGDGDGPAEERRTEHKDIVEKAQALHSQLNGDA
jgi:NAD-dependent dihydropyrimidine dehydrogenase PreA subunit